MFYLFFSVGEPLLTWESEEKYPVTEMLHSEEVVTNLSEENLSVNIFVLLQIVWGSLLTRQMYEVCPGFKCLW